MDGIRFENRLNKDKKYFNTINPVYDNKKEDALNVFEMIDLLNDFDRIFNKFENGLSDLKEIGDYQADRIKELTDEVDEIKRDEEQLSIDFMGFKMKLRRVLKSHYLECQKWGDSHTQLVIKQIAKDLGVDLD